MLIDLYLKVLGESNTECSEFAHVWSMVSAVGALLERRVKLPFGDNYVVPNQYVMLVGPPGARKSTAIKQVMRLMEEAGYTKFAADKATVQSLWRDLAGLDEFGNPKGTTDLAGIDLDDLLGAKEYTPLFICRDEMADFLGDANLEFVRNLGTMWDIDRPYDYRVKGAAPVVIPTPTINLLGGTTPSQYHKMFPPEMEGQGFLSRLIRVAVRETGRRIPDPPKMNPELLAQIVSVMERLQVLSGEAKLSSEANELRKQQYISWKGLRDKRFVTYETRRYTHLMKLCIIKAACSLRLNIEEEDFRWANAFLSYTEFHMGATQGFYGKGDSGDVAGILLAILEKADRPLILPELYKPVAMHMKGMAELHQLLDSMMKADMVQTVKVKNGNDMFSGFMLKRPPLRETEDEFTDYTLLRGIIPIEELM